MQEQPVVTIIGGGLSGLVVAYRLTQLGIAFTLFEANSRFGGRILSAAPISSETYSAAHPAIDLGPSWFWPGQSQIAGLIDELGLSDCVYDQASAGDSLIEYADGSIVSARGGASMAGSYRLSGGLYHLIQRLIDATAAPSLVSNARLKEIRRNSTGLVSIVVTETETREIVSQEVVLAVPPRLVASTIKFNPALTHEYAARLLSVPTWMAGQAKLVAIYNVPFWQINGLSGDAMSQLGPLVEIHDASPKTGGPYALFGFVGVPAAQRSSGDQIKAAAVNQLTRMFGESAANPVAVHLKDWASDPLTATDLDRDNVRMLASGDVGLTMVPDLDVIWAGTETAHSTNHANGYIEGAVEAGERAASLIAQRIKVTSST